MKRSKKLLRTLSFILLQSFVAQQISFADVLTPFVAKQELQSKPEVGLKFADSVASIEDAYKSGGDKLFYLIQDAHTNESGQYNLASALGTILDKEKDLKLVFTEAGVGDNSLSFLRKNKSQKEREDAARSYIKKGYLHGAEYLDITGNHDFTLWGVEDLGLYKEAVEDYRQVAKEREHFDLYLKKIESTTNTLKDRLFNPELQNFDKERKNYREDKLALTSYFNALWRESELQNLPLSAYPHLSLLKSLKEMEEKLDFNKANEEHQKAILGLSKAAQDELKELTNAGQNKADKVLGQGQKEAQAYFMALEDKLGPQKAAYTELSKYFDYLKLAKNVEAKEVIKEIDALEAAVLASLERSEDEKSLVQCENMLFHLKKLFHFTLTPEEYASYKEGAQDFTIESLTGFLNKKIMDLDAYYDRSLFLEKGFDDVLKHAEGFYEITQVRDEQFIKEALSKMESEHSSKAVLITGGFHTSNLKALFKEKNISFVSVTPQVWQETNMKKYEEILLNQAIQPIPAVSKPAVSTAMTLQLVTGANQGDPADIAAMQALGANNNFQAEQAQATGARMATSDISFEGEKAGFYPRKIAEAMIAARLVRSRTSSGHITLTPRGTLNSGMNITAVATKEGIRYTNQPEYDPEVSELYSYDELLSVLKADTATFSVVVPTGFAAGPSYMEIAYSLGARLASNGPLTNMDIPTTVTAVGHLADSFRAAERPVSIEFFYTAVGEDFTVPNEKYDETVLVDGELAKRLASYAPGKNFNVQVMETGAEGNKHKAIVVMPYDTPAGARLASFEDLKPMSNALKKKLDIRKGDTLVITYRRFMDGKKVMSVPVSYEIRSAKGSLRKPEFAIGYLYYQGNLVTWFISKDGVSYQPPMGTEMVMLPIAGAGARLAQGPAPVYNGGWDQQAKPTLGLGVKNADVTKVMSYIPGMLEALRGQDADIRVIEQPLLITLEDVIPTDEDELGAALRDIERRRKQGQGNENRTTTFDVSVEKVDGHATVSIVLNDAQHYGARLATAGDPVAVAQVLSDGAEFLQPATLTDAQFAKKVKETAVFLQGERQDGRYLRRLHTAEQIATVRPTVQMIQKITNFTSRTFARTARMKHMRNATTIANFGVDSAVMADAVVTSAVPDGFVLRQDFIDFTDDVDQLFNELAQNGFIDAKGIPQKKFIDLNGYTGITGLSDKFAAHTNEIYLVIMDRLYIRIEGIYNGGWAESMREGRSDQAKSPHQYLGKLPAEISVHFIRHAAAQEAALSNLSPEARAKYRPINYYVPIFADADEGHLKVKEMIGTMMTMGEEESLIGAVHIEDQAHGCKKCGHMSGKVLDGEDQWVRTLNNARFQLDVMGLRTMIVARTDSEAAEWITSTLSGNDQQFLLGVTDFEKSFQKVRDEELAIANKLPSEQREEAVKAVEAGLLSLRKLMQNPNDPTRIRPYHEVISDIRALGFEGTDLQRVHEYWMKAAGLVRLEEAVADAIRSNPDKVKITEAQWNEFINSIPRSTIYKKVDRLKLMKDKARQIGVNVYTDAEWDILHTTSPESLKNGVSILWDFDLTKTEENSRTMWMIDSGLQMATSRSKAALPYTDFSWFEQHHPNISEVKIWAAALDKEAIRLLGEEDFYGILKKNQNSIKPEVLAILDKYLVERPENPEYFLTALGQLKDLGLSKEQSISLINAVSRLKANNTSPSFVWPEAMSEKDHTQKMSDEEKRVFLKEQGKYVQFQFATYWGSMMAHIMTTLYTKGGVDQADLEMMSDILKNGYLRDGMLTVSRLQYLGRKYGSAFAKKSQDYAGTDLQAKRDAFANGQATVTAAAGGKGDTMVIGGNTTLAPSTAVLAKFGQSLLTDKVLSKLEKSRPTISGARLAATVGSNSIPDAKVRDWVNEMAKYLNVNPDQLEILDASDKERLEQEEIAAGDLIPLPDGNFYARSHEKDVARSVERTMVATSNPNDKGLYNNWKDATAIRPELDARMKGAAKPGEKFYVIPHLMGPEGADLSKAVVQITNSRYVAINMIRMARVGAPAWNTIAKTGQFIKGVHYTGDLDKVNRSGIEGQDDRYFVSFPETREIWSFGSAYGGNALLGKKFVSLRQASWDGLKEDWHAEHMFVLEIEDLAGPNKGRIRRVAGAYPSASGKTNSAMMKVIDALKSQYKVTALSDDIVWMKKKIDPVTGKVRLFAKNPEDGFFGVAVGVNEIENPNFMYAMAKDTILTNVAFNEKTKAVWWEGKGPKPTDIDGWLNWKGEKITEANVNQPWAHPNSRATVAAKNAPNLSPSFNDPNGVPIDIILFGGRSSFLEPLTRITTSAEEGVVDGASMIVEATAAADGKAGMIEADPMAQRPFFAYPEDIYFQHWLDTMKDMGEDAPMIVHVNWFRRDPQTNKFVWPGFGYNLMVMLLALDFDKNNTEHWTKTPIGYIPTAKAFYDMGLSKDDVSPETFEKVLTFSRDLWLQEMDRRDAYFKDMEDKLGRALPPQIWQVNARIRKELEAMPAAGARLAGLELQDGLEAMYPDAFGTGVVNGKTFNVKDIIGNIAAKFVGPHIERMIARRQKDEQFESGQATPAFEAPDTVYTDAAGNQATVNTIRTGLIDNALGVPSKDTWSLRPIPAHLTKPGLEITGPAEDLNMVFGRTNAAADGVVSTMEDAEDAANDAPETLVDANGVKETRGNRLWRSIVNLHQLYTGQWEGKAYQRPGSSKEYRLTVAPQDRPNYFLRLPGLQLRSGQVKYDGVNVPAIIPYMVSYIVKNYDALTKNGNGINFYIPKIENPSDALLIAQMLKEVQDELGIPAGVIRIKMLNEQGTYAASQEVIMWILRDWLIGPNVGRWDYAASVLRMLRRQLEALHKSFPDMNTFTMLQPIMTEYTRRNALLAIMAGGFPIGGMSAVMRRPDASPEIQAKAVRSIFVDKLRERLTGLLVINGKLHDGYRQSWVATVEKEYVKAGVEPLQARYEDLQSLVDRLTGDEKALFQKLNLIDAAGKIQPFVVTDDYMRSLWSEAAWKRMFSIPEGARTESGLYWEIAQVGEYLYQAVQDRAAASVDDFVPGTNPYEAANKTNRIMNDWATYLGNFANLWMALHHNVELTADGPTTKAGQKVDEALIRRLIQRHRDNVNGFFASTPDDGVLDRSKAALVMDVFEKLILNPRFNPYTSKLIITLIDSIKRGDIQEVNLLIDAVTVPTTRDEAITWVKGKLSAGDITLNQAKKALSVHDEFYSYYPSVEKNIPTVEEALQLNDADKSDDSQLTILLDALNAEGSSNATRVQLAVAITQALKNNPELKLSDAQLAALTAALNNKGNYPRTQELITAAINQAIKNNPDLKGAAGARLALQNISRFLEEGEIAAFRTSLNAATTMEQFTEIEKQISARIVSAITKKIEKAQVDGLTLQSGQMTTSEDLSVQNLETLVSSLVEVDRQIQELESARNQVVEDRRQELLGLFGESSSPATSTFKFDEAFFDQPLEIMKAELSARAYNALHNDNINTLGDLLSKTEAEMLRIPNFGKKSLNEVKAALASRGLHLSLFMDDWWVKINLEGEGARPGSVSKKAFPQIKYKIDLAFSTDESDLNVYVYSVGGFIKVSPSGEATAIEQSQLPVNVLEKFMPAAKTLGARLAERPVTLNVITAKINAFVKDHPNGTINVWETDFDSLAVAWDKNNRDLSKVLTYINRQISSGAANYFKWSVEGDVLWVRAAQLTAEEAAGARLAASAAPAVAFADRVREFGPEVATTAATSGNLALADPAVQRFVAHVADARSAELRLLSGAETASLPLQDSKGVQIFGIRLTRNEAGQEVAEVSQAGFEPVQLIVSEVIRDENGKPLSVRVSMTDLEAQVAMRAAAVERELAEVTDIENERPVLFKIDPALIADDSFFKIVMFGAMAQKKKDGKVFFGIDSEDAGSFNLRVAALETEYGLATGSLASLMNGEAPNGASVVHWSSPKAVASQGDDRFVFSQVPAPGDIVVVFWGLMTAAGRIRITKDSALDAHFIRAYVTALGHDVAPQALREITVGGATLETVLANSLPKIVRVALETFYQWVRNKVTVGRSA